MGFFQRLRDALGSMSNSGGIVEVVAPSEQFHTTVEAMTALLERGMTDSQWATFEAVQGKQSLVIQVAGTHINTCKEQVDVQAVARKIGLDALADAIQAGSATTTDKTIHDLSDASPHEIAEIVNAIFIHHHGLTPEYRLEGEIEG